MIPASPTQQGIWFAERARRVGTAYHMPLAVHLDGDVDLPALRAAVTAVLRRHPLLGQAVTEVDGVPHLVPAPRPPRVTDVDGDPTEVVRRETSRPFDLAGGPLCRCTLVHRPGGVTVVVVAHHLVFDGTSKDVFVHDLAAAYASRELPPLPVPDPGPPPDAREFWATRWQGAGDLVLPGLRSTRDPAAGLVPLDLSGLHTTAAGLGVTAFELLVTGWAATLHHYGTDPAVIGVDLGTRTGDGAIGPYVTELPVHIGRSGTFAELARRVRHQLRELYPFRSAPLPRPAQLHTTISYRRAGPDPVFPGLTATVERALPSHAIRATAQLQVVDGPAGLDASLQYRTGALDAATAARVAADLTALLTTTRLSTVETELRGPVRPVPEVMVSELVSGRDAVAVVGADGTRLTYADLTGLAARVATGLRRAGVGPGSLVGLCVRRRPAMVAAILGIWRAGAAYVPLDPDYPPRRLSHMLDDSGAVLVVTDRATAVPEGPPVWCLEDVPAEADGITERGELAYVTYTSGSTGQPKGVAVTHGALANVLLAVRDVLDSGPGDRWLAQTSLSFDISGLELFLPLVTGGTVVLADDPRRAGELIRAEGVTHVQATPTGWRVLLDAGAVHPGLTALVGGEALPPALARELRGGVRRLVNLYGPTETTIWSTYWEVPENPTSVSIGRPLANTTVSIRDGDGTPVPDGVVGELCIGGTGLAAGYLGRADLTAERFPTGPDGRRYRTGDLARVRDGELEFVGRTDTQVKLRGHRIELGEVETRLAEHPGVVAAVAAVRGDDLVGYVQGDVDPAGLRAHVAEVLPAHAVPARIVPVATWPTTPNGKLDRAALPEPPPVAPAANGDGLADRIGEIWREVLRVETLGHDDDLFDLGGHSLTITQIAARIRDRLGVDVPLDTFYDAPTVAEITAVVATLRGGEA